MKFLVFGDLMGRKDVIPAILNMNLSEYDLLIYTGDTPDPSAFKAIREHRLLHELDKSNNVNEFLVHHPLPIEALEKATKEVMGVCKAMKQIPVPIYGVLGNADLRYYEKAVKWPFIRLHNQVIELNDYNLTGYDGRPLYEFETRNDNERGFGEQQIENDLREIFKGVDNSQSILITHAPPYKILDQVEEKMRKYAQGTYGKKAIDGHIGSMGLKNVVDEFKPLLHVFSHIHEDKGVTNRGGTTFVNTGSTGENEEVVGIIVENTTIDVEFIPLKLPSESAVGVQWFRR